MKKISSLGPEGTFSHYAALEYLSGNPVTGFSNAGHSKVDYASKDVLLNISMRSVFKDVAEGRASLGIVPVENSIGGPVGEVMNYLLDFKIYIKDEVLMAIHHNLAGSADLKDIKKIFVHNQTLLQCENFIEKNLNEPVIMPTMSNSESASMLKAKLADGDSSFAAIIPQYSSEIYSLDILKKNIEDQENNVTRFFVLSKEGHTDPTGKDRTSIIAIPTIDQPGLLFNILRIFAEANINLTKIESRPSKEELGHYIFHIDFWGHIKDQAVISAVNQLEKMVKVKILGSYPRKY
ncbi:prephenate dehydratase [Candidatus Woesearchaeota archaeon]|nr:prephenate dehydratase [Candidatus Woesearchaeota archaeon]